MIYFLQRGEDGDIKIGHTKNLPARVAKLQTAHSEPLILLGVIPEEKELHAEFADTRLEGEWFLPSAQLLNTIARFTLRKPFPGWSDIPFYSTTKHWYDIPRTRVKCKGDIDGVTPDQYRMLQLDKAIRDKLREVRSKKYRMGQMKELYHLLGDQSFHTWVNENVTHLSYDEFMDIYFPSDQEK